MDNVQGRRVRNVNLRKRRGTLSVAAGLVLVGGAVLISASSVAAGSDGATGARGAGQAPQAPSLGPGSDPLVDSVQVQSGVIGKCADTGTGCTADADCEGTCDLAGTSCVADADCPAGVCSFTNGICSLNGQTCSGPGSCPGFCPLTLISGCTPGTCCADILGSCISTCVSQTCNDPPPTPCDLDTDCPAGTCANTGQTCRSADECGTCIWTGGPCVPGGSCPFIGTCSRFPTQCGAIGGSCPGFCPATGFTGCTPGTCCLSVFGCQSTCVSQSCGGANSNFCGFGSCDGAETCITGADVCLEGSNVCCGGVEDPDCCENDSQCAAFATKCRPGLCDPITNTCFTGNKAPDCCEDDAQCVDLFTPCRQGICDLMDNRCVLGPKAVGCCETDAQCADYATKCRPGLCDSLTRRCFTGSKDPDCCETDAQCADFATKCSPGLCDFHANGCYTGPKTPADCCEDDAQCLGKCEWCDFATNRCVVLPPEICCETDPDCPGKCDICDLDTNQCVKGIPGCCTSNAQCGKCSLCLFNTCTPPLLGCCEVDAQCGKCETCDLVTNTCNKDVPGCCTSDAQCDGCDECDLVTNTCFPVSCCTPSSQPGEKPKNPTNRYLFFKAGDPKQIQAIRVVFEDLPIPYDSWNGTVMWAGRPREVCENSGKGLETAPVDCPSSLPTDTFWAAPLVCEKAEAHYMDWHGQCVTGTCVGGLEPGTACLVDDDCRIKVALHHEGVVPSGFYRIQVIGDDCQNELEDDYSDPLMVRQSRWGDVCGPGPGGACSAPVDGTVDVANDVLGVLDKFANIINLQKIRADIEPRVTDFKVNVANDVLFTLAAFGGAPYPFLPSGPPPCGP